LVAEDNPLNQKIAVFMLAKQGATVTTVSNGLEAVKALAEEKYDVVLMDLQMPEMDGFEATEYIRNTLKSDVPVLALSASNYEDEIDNCIRSGMNGCVTKPIDSDKLYETIRSISNKHKVTV
jgi:CheY-like chemotaxis protein